MTSDQTTEAHEPEESKRIKKDAPDKIIMKHIYGSLAAGLIPIPFADFAAISGIQLNMLRKLSEIYNVPFSRDMVKNLIGALLGGSAPASAGRILSSAIKTVPVVGQIVGGVGTSMLSGASTYAIGKVFNRHFAEGGTFLTFNPEKAKKFYAEMLKKGETIISEIKAGAKKNADKKA